MYMWEDDNDGGFFACFLIKKGSPFFFIILSDFLTCRLLAIFFSLLTTALDKFIFICFLVSSVNEDGSKNADGRRGSLQQGAWEAIHVIEVFPES